MSLYNICVIKESSNERLIFNWGFGSAVGQRNLRSKLRTFGCPVTCLLCAAKKRTVPSRSTPSKGVAHLASFRVLIKHHTWFVRWGVVAAGHHVWWVWQWPLIWMARRLGKAVAMSQLQCVTTPLRFPGISAILTGERAFLAKAYGK